MNELENRILKKFELTNVIIEIINGIPMFELYSIGEALGYTRITNSRGKDYYQVSKGRIDKKYKMPKLYRWTTVVQHF